MAEFNNNNTVEQESVQSESNSKAAKVYNNKGSNSKGLNIKAMLDGEKKGYSIDGSISVPSQGNIILSRAMYLKEKAIAATQSNPGFGRISYLPIFGSDKRQQTWASLTKQGENLWRTIRSATPHAENYQPGDVMANIFVTGGLRYGLAECRRKIESLTWQDVNNQFVQDGIWRCLTNYPNSTTLGDLQSKLIGWKNKYNGIVNRLAGVKFPDIFPIFHRWEYLSSVIFRDAQDESQAQFYAFTATHLYDWEVRSDPDDPGMDLVPINISDDIDTLLAELERISVKVCSDSDMSDMFADLVLAFPASQCMKWELMKDPVVGSKLRTVHDMNVKWALHNAQVSNVNAPTWHLTPKEGSVHGIIMCPSGKKSIGFMRPVCATNSDKMDMERFFNLSQWVLYDDEMVYEANSDGIELVNTPTEILTAVRIYWFGWDFNTGERDVRYSTIPENTIVEFGSADATNATFTMNYAMMRYLNGYLSFAYFPLMRTHYYQLPAGVSLAQATPSNLIMDTYYGAVMEVERPFVLNASQIRQAHDSARVGLWNIPVILLNGKRNGNK